MQAVSVLCTDEARQPWTSRQNMATSSQKISAHSATSRSLDTIGTLTYSHADLRCRLVDSQVSGVAGPS